MKVDCAIGNDHSENNYLYILFGKWEQGTSTQDEEGRDIGFSDWRCRFFIRFGKWVPQHRTKRV